MTNSRQSKMYSVSLPDSFIRMLQLLKVAGIRPNETSLHILVDAMISEISMSEVYQTPIEEQVQRLCSIHPLNTYIVNSTREQVHVFVMTIREILMYFYMQNTSYSFSTKDIVFSLTNDRVIINRIEG